MKVRNSWSWMTLKWNNRLYCKYGFDFLLEVQMWTRIYSVIIQKSIEAGISDGETLHMFRIW